MLETNLIFQTQPIGVADDIVDIKRKGWKIFCMPPMNLH